MLLLHKRQKTTGLAFRKPRMAPRHSSAPRGDSKGAVAFKGRILRLVLLCWAVVLPRPSRASSSPAPFFLAAGSPGLVRPNLCFVASPTAASRRSSCSAYQALAGLCRVASGHERRQARQRRSCGCLPTLAAVSTGSSVTDPSSSASAPAAEYSAVLTASSSSSSSSSSVQWRPPQHRSTKAWFPTRIQDALSTQTDRCSGDSRSSSISESLLSSSYEALVQRLYLRHVVVETREVAALALDLYQRSLLVVPEGGRDDYTEDDTATRTMIMMDPFGHVARLLSVDVVTASNGGTIGWVDLSRSAEPAPATTADKNDGSLAPSTTNSPSGSDEGPVSRACLEQVVAQRPKAGDLCVVQDPSTKQWHVVLVAELWLQPKWMLTPTPHSRHDLQPRNSSSAIAETDDRRSADSVVGGFRGQNRVMPRENRRFKGRGVRPEFPSELRTYKIQTAGCQMNVADSERLAGILTHELHLRPSGDASKEDARESSLEESWPDVLVLNTCSIRDKAEQKVYNALGPYCAAKRQGQRTVILVTGCVAQQEGQDLLSRLPEVDAVVGPQYIPFLRNVIDLVSTGQQVVATSPMMIAEQDMNVPPVRGHDVRAWVNVIYGCNEHCTYCVVPATRGTEQSRSMEAILAECVDLTTRGYKEITLIGQNIDAYGRDMVPKRTFADLLYFLNARLPNPIRIRYVTSHPRYFGQRVIDAVASLEKVCECFHMPFQAGDDDVLKRMRRGYTYDSYLRIIRRIREKAPDASITTDIIVGFPGESEEAFQKTLQLMEAVKFDNVNSFAYSPRPNTEAALWTEHMLPDAVVADRLQRVQTLAAKHGLERSLRYVGRTEEVLVEDANPRNPLQVMGRTRQGRQVYFDGDLGILRGQFVRVCISEARTWSLVGELARQ